MQATLVLPILMFVRNSVLPNLLADEVEHPHEVILPENSEQDRFCHNNNLLFADEYIGSGAYDRSANTSQQSSTKLMNEPIAEACEISARPECRICLDDGGDMISPCRCAGSSRHVHH